MAEEAEGAAAEVAEQVTEEPTTEEVKEKGGQEDDGLVEEGTVLEEEMDEEEGEEEGLEGFIEAEIEPEEEQLEEEPFVSIFEILDAPRELPEPIDLTLDHVKQVQSELGIITLCWPDIKDPQFEKRVHFPESYVKNTDKEKLLLLYAENFRRQFIKKFPQRKPLFLASPNEVGLMKMVCTTVRPTKLPHPGIEKWDSCVNFVGDYFKYEPLATPTLCPNRLYSPHSVFLRRSGHSFEIANALCSLLIGLGYDAYVVSGYATQDVCLKIMMRVDSPFPPVEEDEEVAEVHQFDAKYQLKPPKDLRSKFLLAMAQREIDQALAEKRKLREAEEARLRELERPPFDELNGQRVHAWVLLLAGVKGIEESIFIEATTGRWYHFDCESYLGIESIWNHSNYWVNLQDCSSGLDKLGFDFTNLNNWEHFLIGEPIQWRERHISDEMEDDEIELLKIAEEKHLDMPTGWSLPIFISFEALSDRFPNAVKKTLFKRTIVEQYSPHVQSDGLVTRICRYNNLECSPNQLHTIEERYLNRVDKLVKVISDINDGIITEYYRRGREDAAKRHIYKSGLTSSVESPRTIEFYDDARADGLNKLELELRHFVEHFVKPENKIIYRHISFAQRGKPPPGMVEGNRRIVIRIIEKFDRDESKPASQDIAVREFAIVEREINIKYHYELGKVTASTRLFKKPPIAEMGSQLRFNPSLTVGYQSEVGAKPPSQLQLFRLLEQQLKDEDDSLYHIRDMEDQVLEFLKLRFVEVTYPKLTIPLFDRVNNKENRRGMREREQQQKEQKEREVEDEIDYLAPYINRLGNPKKLSRYQSVHITELCLKEFKQMLLDRANGIQKLFEAESVKLVERQNWYISLQDRIGIEEETEYFEEINRSSFYLHSLELRLSRYRDLSPHRYNALEHYLAMDPRLTH